MEASINCSVASFPYRNCCSRSALQILYKKELPALAG